MEFNIFRVFRILFYILLFMFWVEFVPGLISAFKEVCVNDAVYLSDDKPKTYDVVRVVDKEMVEFSFYKKSIFFLYRDKNGIQRAGHYWKYLPILEKKMNIPYVGSNFERIEKKVILDDTEDVRAALDKLNLMPEYPFSLSDKFKVLMQVAFGKYLNELP